MKALHSIRRSWFSFRRTGLLSGAAFHSVFTCAICNTSVCPVQSGNPHYEPFSRKNQVLFCPAPLPYLRNFQRFSQILPSSPNFTTRLSPPAPPLDGCYNFFPLFYEFLSKASDSFQKMVEIRRVRPRRSYRRFPRGSFLLFLFSCGKISVLQCRYFPAPSAGPPPADRIVRPPPGRNQRTRK